MNNISKQIDKLRELQDGWYDGEGESYDVAKLDWLCGVLQRNFFTLPAAYIYPNVDGLVGVEWDSNNNSVDADFDLQNKSVWILAIENGKDEQELKIDFTNPFSERLFFSFLSYYLV